MSIEKQLQNEIDILEQDLNEGRITLKEYNSRLAEIEEDARELYRDGRGE